MTTLNDRSPMRWLLAIALLAIIGALLFAFLTTPDQRSTGQKLGDAVDALPQGVDKAARQMEDRTPADKIGDAMKDTREDVEKNTR